MKSSLDLCFPYRKWKKFQSRNRCERSISVKELDMAEAQNEALTVSDSADTRLVVNDSTTHAKQHRMYR